MTNSKAPWLTRGGAIALMAAAGIALAACSGGGGLNEDEAAGLLQEVEDAQTQAATDVAARVAAEAKTAAAELAQTAAEAEKLKAETEKAAAETARDLAVAQAKAAAASADEAAASAREAAAALTKAQAAQQVAEDAKDAAEAAQQDAEDAAAEADRLRRLAVAATDTEERRRQQAEAEQDRLEQVAEDARQEVNRGQARVALAGLETGTAAGTVSDAQPKRGSTTSLTTNVPDLSLRASGAPSIGSPWSGTALTSTTSTHSDNLVVYTNIGPATRVGIQTKHVDFGGDGNPPDDYLGKTIDSNDADLIRSSVFPSTENDPREYSNNRESDNPQPPGMDDIYRVNGSYDGASGYFVCEPAPADQKCSVKRLGNRYLVDNGTWTFYVRGTATVSQDDQSWMYFGWWKREQLSDGVLSYASFSGGVNSAMRSADTDNEFDDLTGSATYRGPAVGQYAIYQPAGSDSGTGSFRASAVLSANFDTNMLSGTVASFSNDSSWSLTLNEEAMTGANVAESDDATVTWEIGDATSRQSGSWTAEFFSESPYAGQTPDGVAGTFDAQFDSVGRLIGAFGARK